MKPIFPETKIRDDGSKLFFLTYIRLTDLDGHYYLTLIVCNSTYNSIEDRIGLIQKFLFEVYYLIICAKVDKNAIINFSGEKMFVSDKDQTSEKERVKNLIS